MTESNQTDYHIKIGETVYDMAPLITDMFLQDGQYTQTMFEGLDKSEDYKYFFRIPGGGINAPTPDATHTWTDTDIWQHDVHNNGWYRLGFFDVKSWTYYENEVIVHYSNGNGPCPDGGYREAYVHFVCSEISRLQTSEHPQCVYHIYYHTRQSCRLRVANVPSAVPTTKPTTASPDGRKYFKFRGKIHPRGVGAHHKKHKKRKIDDDEDGENVSKRRRKQRSIHARAHKRKRREHSEINYEDDGK